MRSEEIRVKKVQEGILAFIHISATAASCGGIQIPDEVGLLQARDRYYRRLVTDGIEAAEKLLGKNLDIEIADFKFTTLDTPDDLIFSASKLLALLLYGNGFSKSDLVRRDGKWVVLREADRSVT